jgi:hypothetical protein
MLSDSLSETFINVMNVTNVKTFMEVKHMVSLTLAVPEDMKKQMDKYSEINWSAVARNAIMKRLDWLAEMDKLTAKSELTDEDTIRLGRKVNKAVAKRYLKELK